ncbi:MULTISPECIES: alpha/beta hydrolase-fold protein [unclassified Polaribacter]|uniref:alpha/beta hydrolase-fold protein n=1 Tax=unclassified Polaribacter TaxID=196858 RepID=UPI00140ACEC6|nr:MULTISPECIES: alpha/beta hydrolase-fold protein [unclassified Polaribacter]
MKKLLLTTFLLIFTIQFFAQSDEGKIVNQKFNSESFGTEREIKIFLPIEYELEPDMEFPVIYLLDAQNESLFNLAKSTIDYLIGSNEIQPSILVGIISENRQFEFLSKNENKETLERYEKVGGSINLMESLKNEVFPYIDKNYRVKSNRIGIGHSLGGTFLTETLIDKPKLFNALILISPNYVYDNEKILKSIDKISINIKSNNNYIYSISGTIGKFENEFNPVTKKVDSLFKLNKLKSTQWSYRKIDNYNHGTILLEGIQKGLIDYSNNFDLSKINNNGYEQLSVNNYEKAFEIFQRGIELFPNDSNIYDSFAEAKEKSGNRKEAKELYLIALANLKKEKKKYKEKEFLRRKNIYKKNIKRVSN